RSSPASGHMGTVPEYAGVAARRATRSCVRQPRIPNACSRLRITAPRCGFVPQRAHSPIRRPRMASFLQQRAACSAPHVEEAPMKRFVLLIAFCAASQPAVAFGQVKAGGKETITLRGIIGASMYVQDANFGLGNGQKAQFVTE